jgi:prepilin-type N-terminal cleavage/methylation domain-containing protein
MRQGRGFTLTEMLVVIAVIAVLTAILLPVFSTVR